MHEYSIVQALLGQVEALAAKKSANAVHRVHVSLGELAGVDSGLLATAWQTFRERTICASAELELKTVPAQWECPRCHSAIPRGTALVCKSCNEAARLLQGDELMLDSVELEVP